MLRFSGDLLIFFHMETIVPVRFKLRDLLDQRGMSRQALANMVGRKRQFISRLAGKNPPTRMDLDTLSLLFEALELESFDELFEYEPD